jgi:prepilin-type N-terminal cleavage/methylation domain-containing protein
MKAKGFTIVELMIVCTVIGVVSSIALPSLLSSRLGANEISAIGSLKTVVVGQQMFKNGVCADENHNGEGEYGFLVELSGASNYRGTRVNCASSSMIPKNFDSNVSQKSGYRFCTYLCTKADGSRATRKRRKCTNGAAYNEMNYLCYAWPDNFGSTGRRVFAVSALGNVMQCPNRKGKITKDTVPNYRAAIDRNSERNWNGNFVTNGQRGCHGKLRDNWAPIG